MNAKKNCVRFPRTTAVSSCVSARCMPRSLRCFCACCGLSFVKVDHQHRITWCQPAWHICLHLEGALPYGTEGRTPLATNGFRDFDREELNIATFNIIFEENSWSGILRFLKKLILWKFATLFYEHVLWRCWVLCPRQIKGCMQIYHAGHSMPSLEKWLCRRPGSSSKKKTCAQ